MTWKNVEQFKFSPGFLAAEISKKLLDGEPPITVKEMLNAIAFNVVADELVSMIVELRHGSKRTTEAEAKAVAASEAAAEAVAAAEAELYKAYIRAMAADKGAKQ